MEALLAREEASYLAEIRGTTADDVYHADGETVDRNSTDPKASSLEVEYLGGLHAVRRDELMSSVLSARPRIRLENHFISDLDSVELTEDEEEKPSVARAEDEEPEKEISSSRMRAVLASKFAFERSVRKLPTSNRKVSVSRHKQTSRNPSPTSRPRPTPVFPCSTSLSSCPSFDDATPSYFTLCVRCSRHLESLVSP